MTRKSNVFVQNRIVLIPAYDLLAVRLVISAKDDPEEMALSVNGKKKKLKSIDWYTLGKNLKIPEKVVQNVIKVFIKKKEKLIQKTDESFLDDGLKKELVILISSRLDKLSVA